MGYKAECDKSKALKKLTEEMEEEKKHILIKYNAERSKNENDYDDDEKKESVDPNELRRQDTIRELEELEREAVEKSKGICTIDIVHIFITLVLMYISFHAGQWMTDQALNGLDKENL